MSTTLGKQPFTVRLPSETLEKLRQRATETGRTPSSLVTEAVVASLSRKSETHEASMDERISVEELEEVVAALKLLGGSAPLTFIVEAIRLRQHS